MHFSKRRKHIQMFVTTEKFQKAEVKLARKFHFTHCHKNQRLRNMFNELRYVFIAMLDNLLKCIIRPTNIFHNKSSNYINILITQLTLSTFDVPQHDQQRAKIPPFQRAVFWL